MNTPNIVWNIQIRIFHWLVALPVLMNFFLEGGDGPHNVLGYVALSALILRLIFIKRPVIDRSPIATSVYALIWLVVILLGVTGYMMGLDAFWGEDWLEEIHEALATVMKVLVFLHLVGIAKDAIKFKRKTWLAMITGKRS